MWQLLLGLAAALAAAGVYSASTGLQALEARTVEAEHSLRFSLLKRLAHRRRWIAGTALGAAGWGLQALALTLAPLTVVQPALALTLVVLLAVGVRVLGERVGRREVAGVLAVAAGIAGLGAVAPAHEASHANARALAVVLAVLGAAALVPYVLPRRFRSAGTLVAAASGIAYAWDGLATKFATDDLSGGAWLGLAFWVAAMSLAAGVGTLSEMTALQHRPATQVAPIVYGLNTLVPVLLAPLLASEPWSSGPLQRAALSASLVLVAAGVVLLARSPAVGAVLRTEAATSSASGTG